MKRIQILSIDTILPATYTPDHQSTPQTIDLTPWDLQFLQLGTIQKGLLFNHPSPYNHIISLKTSLSRTLDLFYPLAGRLRSVQDVENDAKFYYIECNNGGVEFVEAVADDLTVDCLLESEYDVEAIRSLFPLNGLMNLECDVKPFFAVQVTHLAGGGGGGCFIGCTLSHMFADGTSFWHFMNSWSETCRSGFDCVSNPPLLDRMYPLKSKVWIPNKSIVRVRRPSSGNLKEMMFHFSKEKIALLKSKAVEESGNQMISSLQAVLAHIWRSVSRCRRLNDDDDNDDVRFVIAIGDRTRTEPPLHAHYFGNAVHLAIANLKRDEILAEDGLGFAANHLNELISRQNRSLVMDFIRSCIDRKPVLLGTGSVLSNCALVTSSSPRFDVYGNDFGWGKPVAVRSGGAHKMNGKVTLFSGAENGSIDVEVCLMAETLEGLKRDSEFNDFAC